MQPIPAVLGPGWRQDAALSAKWWSVFETLQAILRRTAEATLSAEVRLVVYCDLLAMFR